MVETDTQKNLYRFAKIIYQLLKSDRDVIHGVGGFTGEGKSTYLIQLLKAYNEIQGQEWNYSLMTWSRKELLLWIDGKPGSQKDKEGLKEGQLPEYSGVVADELFNMFYRRNWYDNQQIDAIATFNMCRDRHLLVAGNVPNFWDLDAAFTTRVRFYAYIVKRGVAWIFQQENNPFSKDAWNTQENRKLFRKHKNPYKCPNFLFEICFNDLTQEEKATYLALRNDKRLAAIKENTQERAEKYSAIKAKRDAWLKIALNLNRLAPKDKRLTQRELTELTGDSQALISLIGSGAR
jgi:hypothetical protein